ncbi:MAG: sel1 repeat family protein, partial [Xanthomonadales bacterium]|nr:sel1 repeat family protein [Xanthomonadales bacterium]
MGKILVALLLTMGLSACVAESSENALKAANRGDYATALRIWSSLAEQGYADAQYSLGNMYYFAQGVPKDDKEAVNWYRLAAGLGNSGAQYRLGNIFYFGQGAPLDYKEAV